MRTKTRTRISMTTTAMTRPDLHRFRGPEGGDLAGREVVGLPDGRLAHVEDAIVAGRVRTDHTGGHGRRFWLRPWVQEDGQ
jgi:hypothetical protein